MANRLDPYHLVAYINHIFNGEQEGFRRSLDLSLNPEYGITNEHDTSMRILHILNAIQVARICDFKNKLQLMVIASQFEHEDKKIWLIISENQDVDPCVVDHLESHSYLMRYRFE